MLPWYSLASVQMANNLIKWWRTKFLNGYKQFSGEFHLLIINPSTSLNSKHVIARSHVLVCVCIVEVIETHRIHFFLWPCVWVCCLWVSFDNVAGKRKPVAVFEKVVFSRNSHGVRAGDQCCNADLLASLASEAEVTRLTSRLAALLSFLDAAAGLPCSSV